MKFSNPIPPWFKMTISKFKNENKKDYVADLLSGVTVGLVRLPQAMAHGMLSDMPIQYGIYTDLFGCIFYSIFTSSRHSSAGSTAFLMMIVGASMNDFFQD